MSDDDWLRTGIGASTPDTITIRGHNLADELMGRVTFTELAYLLVSGQQPTDGQARMLDAVLVSLADHGLTPTVLAARLTYTGAPEALQGAVASGLLGAGSVFLGVVEDTARVPSGHRRHRRTPMLLCRARLAAGKRVPGLGHPVHKLEDPRTPRMYAIAEQTGQLGPNLQALRWVAAAHAEQTGRALPINGAGVAGAALADLGFTPAIVRGFALIARTAGVVAHLAEEMQQPIGMQLFKEVDSRAHYTS